MNKGDDMKKESKSNASEQKSTNDITKEIMKPEQIVSETDTVFV